MIGPVSGRSSARTWLLDQAARATGVKRCKKALHTGTSQATSVLEKAIDSIDTEIEIAKARADEAKLEHEALKASASERKQAIQCSDRPSPPPIAEGSTS